VARGTGDLGIRGRERAEQQSLRTNDRGRREGEKGIGVREGGGIYRRNGRKRRARKLENIGEKLERDREFGISCRVVGRGDGVMWGGGELELFTHRYCRQVLFSLFAPFFTFSHAHINIV